MNDADSFADAPMSIGEIKADKATAGGGGLWSPRDALISMLREIDSGKVIPTELIITYIVVQDGQNRAAHVCSCRDRTLLSGALVKAQNWVSGVDHDD